jgi:hypothetical protein
MLSAGVENWIVAQCTLDLASDVPLAVKLLFNHHDPSSRRYVGQVLLFDCSRPHVYLSSTPVTCCGMLMLVAYLLPYMAACTAVMVANFKMLLLHATACFAAAGDRGRPG